MAIKLRICESDRSLKRISESRLLKEGPGGGVTARIDGISDVKITSAYVEEDWDGGAKLSVTGRLSIDDLYVSSYYYGTGNISDVKVRLNSVIVDTDYNDIENIDDLPDNELIDLAYDALDTYDANHFEASYGGTIGDEDSVWEGELVDDDLADFIDKAVDGENYIEEYLVETDNGDYDYYESEEEALRIAEEMTENPEYAGCLIEVKRRLQYYGWDGNYEDFIDSVEDETIYSEYNEVESEE